MKLGSLIRKGVALADQLTGGSDGVQDTVYIYPWIGNTDSGGPDYGSAVEHKAIVEEKEYTRKMADGSEITQKASITIPRPVAANGATDRREPIDPRDKIVLPSGFTGPILNVDGITDPQTHAPFMFQIILG